MEVAETLNFKVFLVIIYIMKALKFVSHTSPKSKIPLQMTAMKSHLSLS